MTDYREIQPTALWVRFLMAASTVGMVVAAVWLWFDPTAPIWVRIMFIPLGVGFVHRHKEAITSPCIGSQPLHEYVVEHQPRTVQEQRAVMLANRQRGDVISSSLLQEGLGPPTGDSQNATALQHLT